MSALAIVLLAAVVALGGASVLLFPRTASAAQIIVTTEDDSVADDDECSLREAIDNANDDAATHDDCDAGAGDDEITFDGDVNLIELSSQLPIVESEMTIDGDMTVTIDGVDTYRIFLNADSGELTLRGLALTRGSDADGGAIQSNGELTIIDCMISASVASAGGGAIWSNGTVSVVDSAFEGNSAVIGGGAIEVEAGALTVAGSTFEGNLGTGDSSTYGGAIAITGAETQAAIEDSTFNLNDASSAGGAIHFEGATLNVSDSGFTGNTAAVEGGAIATQNAVSVSITGSSFTANEASDGGAIDSALGTSVDVMNSTFEGNTAKVGGAIHAQLGSTLTIDGTTFEDNSSASGDIPGGGAIATNLASLVLSNSEFSDNAANYGAAIAAVDSDVTIDNSSFESNDAVVDGGAVLVNGGTLDVADATFDGNSTANGGGIMAIGAAVTVDSSTFSSNTGLGAAIFLDGGETILVNSTIGDNTSPTMGAGVFVLNADLLVTNATITGNSGATGGGGIEHQGTGTVAVRNTILFENGPNNCEGTISAAGSTNNLEVAAPATCPGVTVAEDPLLGALNNNGGPTLTHALPQLSPAIDAADEALCPEDDQRGAPRPNGPGCDIGAYEAESPDALTLTKETNRGLAMQGEEITYTIEITNTGEDLQVAMLHDPVPEGVFLVSIEEPEGWTCTTEITCTAASIPNGAELTFTIVVEVEEDAQIGSSIDNIATLNAGGFQRQAEANTLVEGGPLPPVFRAFVPYTAKDAE